MCDANRTVRSKPAEKKWSAENLKLVTGVPWEPSPCEDSADSAMPSLDLPVADPEVESRRPEVWEKEYITSRIYLREKDSEEFARTARCCVRDPL